MKVLRKIWEVLTSNRFKSFYWRTGMMMVALCIDFIITNLELFELPDYITVGTGLFLGEVSKAINNSLSK